MRTHHWIFSLLIFFLVYLIGVKFPGFGQTVLGKVGL